MNTVLKGRQLYCEVYRRHLPLAVVVLPPLGLDGRACSAMVDSLPLSVSVILTDLPGHGLSAHHAMNLAMPLGQIACDVAVTLNSLHPQSVILVGVGLGALVARATQGLLKMPVSGLLLVGEDMDAGAAVDVAQSARNGDRASTWGALCRSWSMNERLDAAPSITADRITAAFARQSLSSLEAAARLLVDRQRGARHEGSLSGDAEEHGAALVLELVGPTLRSLLEPEGPISTTLRADFGL